MEKKNGKESVKLFGTTKRSNVRELDPGELGRKNQLLHCFGKSASSVLFGTQGFKSMRQSFNHSNLRFGSVALPFDLTDGFVKQFSVSNDQVWNSFWGTGTTMFAAIAA